MTKNVGAWSYQIRFMKRLFFEGEFKSHKD